MIICDGEHKEQVEGTAGIKVVGEQEVDGEKVHVEFLMSFEKKQYCKDCFIEKATQVNLQDIIKGAHKPPVKP